MYDALARHGRVTDAVRLMRERYGPMLARGATTLWESFEPTASLCHGFSATPTYQLSRRVLGVGPGRQGMAEIEVGPDLADLDYAEGVAPLAGGDVTARIERDRVGFTARYRAPEGFDLRVAPAPGLVVTSGPTMVRGEVELRFVPA